MPGGSVIYNRARPSYCLVTQMGCADDGVNLLDAATPINSNRDHNYGTDLSSEQMRELIDYLETP